MIKKTEENHSLRLRVGLPRFELGQAEPKSVVLPLHHKPVRFSNAKLNNPFESCK